MDAPNTPPDEQSRRAWRFLRFVAICLVGLTGVSILLIAAGAFDPRPLGRLSRTDTPGVHTLPTTGAATFPQSVPWATPPDRFSVRLRASYVDGQSDIGYGLALGDEGDRLVAAVSPLGYASIWEERVGERTNHLPWQPWPHVHIAQAENELWLDVEASGENSRVTARVNRELLWQGEIARLSPPVALWLGSFEGPTTVDFHALEWFATPEPSDSAPTARR